MKLSPLFRNLFNFCGFMLCGLSEDKHRVTLVLDRTRKTANCPSCGKRCTSIEDTYTRQIRDLDLGPKLCFLSFTERKIRCHGGYHGVEQLDFVDKYSPYAKRFEDYVSVLCEKMTVSDAASIAAINWKAAKRIDKKYLSR